MTDDILDRLRAATEGTTPGPTDAQINSACLSYRHDFGLLDDEERAKVRFHAVEWLRAWRKATDAEARDLIPEAAATIAALRAENEALRGAVGLIAKAERLRDHYHSLPNERLPIGSKPSVKGRARDAWMRAYRKAARHARDVLGPAF